MAASSFRSDAGSRPAHYRTPSPPRHALEPLSPTIAAISESTNGRVHTQSTIDGFRPQLDANHESLPSDRSNSRDESYITMDAFATIALAVNSNPLPAHQPRSNHTPSQSNPENLDHFERPSKRARSEKLPSPQLHRTWIRPATSYEQAFDSRTLEAELLLNFSQEARFASPWPAAPALGTYTWSKSGTSVDTIHASAPETIDRVVEPHEDSTTTHAAVVRDEREEGRSNQAGNIGHLPPNEVVLYPNLASKSPLPQRQTLHVQPSETIQSDTEFTTILSQDTVELETHANSRVQREEIMVVELPKVSEDLRDLDAATLTDDVQAVRDTSGGSDEQQENAHSLAGDVKSVIGQLDREPSVVDLPQKEPSQNHVELIAKEKHEGTLIADVSQQEPLQIYGEPNSEETNKDSSETGATDPQFLPPENETTVPTDHRGPPACPVSGPILSKIMAPSFCAACNFTRNSLDGDSEHDSTSWISCDACKSWFHFACAGFKSEREVRGVDKFRCRKCKPLYGATTYVRKSSRAHSAIDYAGLHQGVIKTSDENPEHHYIKPIKDGTIKFLPETFARMRPELVTAEYFERRNGMKEPIVIPASFNPRPKSYQADQQAQSDVAFEAENVCEKEMVEGWLAQGYEVESVPDHGQDALDMVIPRGLTVRKVAELYGPEEKVEVIDVKSQNGENKKWNMRRWVDYYESQGNKIVRNVISLEVSQSKLGRLIRRPQIVRDLDLQDAVWPAELQAKGEYPKVQFYCLMSVADCFTDFHIDFGGSSVFYHILKGRKTFLFIPPKEKHLKKYEEWCMSPAQNWTFLADQTKECYRVDLSEGDTMLIPAGWIHAVWTPEDSLVIGGNFLTRMHYGMQIRVAQVEKATGVARKFRYPYFQKLLWYAAIRYLEDDPLPDSVKEILKEGCSFFREQPAYYEFDEWAEDSKLGAENYHARYYSQAELEGLPDLLRYLLRSALIENGTINEGITQETRNAVRRSIPKGHGEPLDIMKIFAMWCAWKRGNEPLPDWAYASASPGSPEKLSAATTKKANRDSALQGPRRQSARRQSQLPPLTLHTGLTPQTNGTSPLALGNPVAVDNQEIVGMARQPQLDEPSRLLITPTKRRLSIESAEDQRASLSLNPPRKRNAVVGVSSHRKPACESCRKRRRACKHRDHLEVAGLPSDSPGNAEQLVVPATQPAADFEPSFNTSLPDALTESDAALDPSTHHDQDLPFPIVDNPTVFEPSDPLQPAPWDPLTADSASSSQQNKGRSKACNDCRKSKRRCIHDEFGNEDRVKASQAAIPRPTATLKHKRLMESQDGQVSKKAKKSTFATTPVMPVHPSAIQQISATSSVQAQRQAPVALMGVQLTHPAPEQAGSVPIQPVNEVAKLAAQAFARLGCNDVGIRAESDINTSSHTEPATVDVESNQPEASPFSIIPELQHRPMGDGQQTHTPTSDLKVEAVFESTLLGPKALFEQPNATSSLVSPPASTNSEAAETPRGGNANISPSTSSSRHSSRQPEPVQRYTPESGLARRTSSSSVDAGGKRVESSSPMTSLSNVDFSLEELALPTVSSSGRKGTKIRVVSNAVADEESLRLIKELQAQDYGLRRRGRM